MEQRELRQYIKSKRGNATDLAKYLDVSLSYLSQMASGKAAISTDRAVKIETKTGRQVTRKHIFPDSWEAHWPELKDKRRKTHVTQS